MAPALDDLRRHRGAPALIGTALILWRPTEFAALLGVAIAAYVPVLVGWLALRHPREPGEHSAEHSAGALWRETFHNSNALFAFFALSNVDILVARNVLDAHQAGLYAGGLILVKAVLFLPQFVVVLAFPSMANGAATPATLLQSLPAVVLLGAAGRGGAPCSPGWLSSSSAASQYAAIEDELWALRSPRRRALDAAALGLQRAGPSGPRVGAPGLGRPAGGGGARPAGRHPSNELLLLVLVVDAALLVALLAVSLGAQPPLPSEPGRRGGCEAQWAAACQLLPVPTETSRGTVSSAAEAICSRTSASSASRSPSATSKTSSSWTWSSIREARAAPRAAPGRR